MTKKSHIKKLIERIKKLNHPYSATAMYAVLNMYYIGSIFYLRNLAQLSKLSDEQLYQQISTDFKSKQGVI